LVVNVRFHRVPSRVTGETGEGCEITGGHIAGIDGAIAAAPNISRFQTTTVGFIFENIAYINGGCGAESVSRPTLLGLNETQSNIQVTIGGGIVVVVCTVHAPIHQIIRVQVGVHEIPQLGHQGWAGGIWFQVSCHQASISLSLGNAGSPLNTVGHHDVSVASHIIIAFECFIRGCSGGGAGA